MNSSFQTNNKTFKKFESLYIWKQLKENRGRSLPWYFAVSINRMPAKYLISRSIPCKFTDLTNINEQKLWEEFTNLTEIFFERWKRIRSEEIDIIPELNQQKKKTSLMDLTVELVKRMLTHCNFCRWNCQIDRSIQQTVTEDDDVSCSPRRQKKHGTCQLESTSKVSSYFHHRGEELIFRGTCACCFYGSIS
jgi:putative pyruvate formate lyase activating enzyme